MRVRVAGARLAVGRPARVADPHPTGRGVVTERPLQLGELAGALHDTQGPVDQRYAGGVVPAVLETPKALQDDGERFVGSDVAHDAAHGCLSLAARSVWGSRPKPAGQDRPGSAQVRGAPTAAARAPPGPR